VTYGSPPKIVWLAVGNAGTSVIRELLVNNRATLEGFVSDTEAALLVLPLAPEPIWPAS
jgi:predicted nuclease of predicted toxin-antitoxin system